ncbi:SET domain containing protein [Acanthamoeba castellanii str. Neff]|uniref:SET domain containing protein n=1 Tax=Acanthamoeba castellanii (strain ATCC 30010 / Neff) TaxID=1257118 RepID=L8GPN6_ACACF|nr:SET domain containing protein [Acanthamoeba castellanii str. Neff]ELR14578.1 SET domain containing protein [Acanthamoeba castellanii str. Neff]
MGGRVAYDPSSHRLLPDYFPELERCDVTHTTSQREDVSEEAHDTDAAAATTATTATTRPQPTDRPLFECHSRCGCSADCASRVVQKGITLPLEVFMSATKGWSVRVLSPVRKGQFVSEYAGEVVSTEEAQRRWRDEYDRAGLNYLLVVREFIPARGATLRTNIDGTRLGNVSRFFNHSCDPNMLLFLVRVGSLIPRLAFFVCRDVAAGEELTYDYGHGSTQAADAPATRQCHCGARHCRGVLPFDPLA